MSTKSDALLPQIVLSLDIDDFLQLGPKLLNTLLIEELSSVAQYIRGLLFQHLEQEHGHHVLELRVLAEVDLVVHPVLDFLFLKLYHLLPGYSLDPCNIVMVNMLSEVVHVLDVVLGEVVLF